MISMSQTYSIRQLRKSGESISEIARKVGVSRNTVYAKLAAPDLSQQMPAKEHREKMLDAYRPVIEGYLDEDARGWRKQRHTARRIWQRLRDEHSIACSELDWLHRCGQFREGAQETGGPHMRDPRHPRHFTDEFKRQIVDLYNAGKPKREIVDEYDLGKSTAERRVKSINATGSPRAADNRTPEQNRILELERENRRLRMEVDVLKQAAPICARK